jgi:hypothetical protein
MADAAVPVEPADLVERILAEGALGMSAIARLCGTFRGGAATHPSTPTRWATQGVRLADGRVVKLEAVKLNGRLISSKPALIRFIQAQQTTPPNDTPPRSPAAVSRASKAADAKLREMGA